MSTRDQPRVIQPEALPGHESESRLQNPGNLLRGNAPSDVVREQCVSYPPSDEDPGTGALNSHPKLRRQTSPSLGIMWVVMLASRVEFSRVASVAVTVTATPSGSSGIDLELMEHAADPSRCATNVPQGYCLVAVQADQEGGPRPLMRKHRLATPGSNRRPAD
jgi:hypothetical protein